MKSFLLSQMMVLALLIASNAWAGDEQEEARAAFNDGKDLFKAGEFAKAANAFRRADELSPNWKLHYNIGQSEAAAKRYGLSLEAFEKYLAEGGDEVRIDRQKEVQKEIERLRGMVGFLKIDAPKGSVVSVDGIERSAAPVNWDLPVAASVSHVVSATIDGEIVAEQSVRVSGGRTSSVELKDSSATDKIDDSEAVEEVPVEEQEEGRRKNRSTLKAWGWISVSLGGALLVGGGITGGLALSAKNEVEENCPDGCYSDDYGLIDTRDNLALATDILLGVSGAVVIAGVVMLIVDSTREDAGSSNIVFVPSPGGFGMLGRF